MMETIVNKLKSPFTLPLVLIGMVVTYYWVICPIYPPSARPSEIVIWMISTWNSWNDLLHGYAVPFLFIAFCYRAYKPMKAEPKSSGKIGMVLLLFGVLFFVASARTIQPRLALIGLPFLISGSVIYVLGWKAGRHLLFPAFFWYFAIPVPGIQQATNVLQVIVTETCYEVGTLVGMDLVHSGNNITSATNKWQFNIAEGCSGIRSLMALMMIAAVYAYYSQKELWKKAALFAMALPLALLGNFFRVFTILALAELGYDEFAAKAYHDWAGLLLFFPAALLGLFLTDRLLNRSKYKRVVKVRTQSGDSE